MGGGSAKKWVKASVGTALGTLVGGPVGGLAGGAAGLASESDTVKGMLGQETKAEKNAKAEQQASLLAAKNEADTSLELRKNRMGKKQQGRGSLLTGTELGIQQDQLKSTLG